MGGWVDVWMEIEGRMHSQIDDWTDASFSFFETTHFLKLVSFGCGQMGQLVRRIVLIIDATSKAVGFRVREGEAAFSPQGPKAKAAGHQHSPAFKLQAFPFNANSIHHLGLQVPECIPLHVNMFPRY